MKTSTVVTVTAATVLSAGVAYAFYFDYKRRNDTAFRKSLRKQSKKAASSSSAAKGARTPAERAAALDRAYAEVKRAQKEEAPKDMASLRAYFDRQVSLGETLSAAGPQAHFDAAVAFTKALHVYVEPLELLEIYGKALNKEVYQIVMELIAKDMIENSAAGAGAASAGASSSSKLADIDDDDAPTKPATAATAPTDTTTATTTAPSEPAVPATAPTAGAPPSAPSLDDDVLASHTGPASTTSSQEWEAVSASSALGHGGVSSATSQTQLAQAPVPAATSTVDSTLDSLVAATEEASAPAPTLAPAHAAAPVVSEVDAVAEEEDLQSAAQAVADDANANGGNGELLEELEPDAIGEETTTGVPTADVATGSIPSADTTPSASFLSESQPSAAGSFTTASASTDSWTSATVPRSPSGGNRDQPRWS